MRETFGIMEIHGIDSGQFVDVVKSSLEFRSTWDTLVLGGYGYAMSKVLEEEKTMRRWLVVILLGLGLAVCATAFYLLGLEYEKLARAISRDDLLDYSTGWMSGMRICDYWLAGACVWLFVNIGAIRKTKVP